MSAVFSAAGLALLALLLVLAGGWGALALNFSAPSSEAWRGILAAGFAGITLLALAALASPRWRWPAVAAYAALWAALLVWWLGIAPSNERNWQPDVARLPTATFDGDWVTLHDIRNFDYRSETDFTPAWNDRRFNLNQLEGVDLVAVYWMGPAIAHIFLSFRFADGEPLAVSIETRKEVGEGYSTVKGFFRQYELYYVVADERDVIRLRTNYRHDPPEDVYVYPLAGKPEALRRLFMDYMARINSLAKRPEFYNSLTTNCTTTIWMHSHVNPESLPLSWKILASGYVPEYLHEHGRLADGDKPLAELQRRGHVNARAQAADKAADFSRRIRAIQ